jgi:hypothetical protein
MSRSLALGLLALFLIGSSPSGQHQEKPPKEHRADAQSIPTPIVKSPIVTPAVGLPAASTKQQRTSYSFDYLKKAFAPEMLANWALVAAALFAGWVGLRTLGAIEEQARLTRIALRANRTAAIATKSSADSARAALLLNVRPVIEVHPISLVVDERPSEYRPGYHEITTRLVANFAVINTGSTQATIEAQSFHLWLKNRREPYPPEPGSGSLRKITPLGHRLESQQRVIAQLVIEWDDLRSTIPEDASLSRLRAFLDNTLIAHLGASIGYGDEAGRKHETSFCQAWDRAHGHFIVPDEMPSFYNYRS